MHQIQQRYHGVLARCQALQAGETAIRFAEQFQAGLWQEYFRLLAPHRHHIENKVVLDFGCKFGHTAPLFFELGARKVIGVDVEPDYVKTGRAIFSEFLPDFSIIQSQHGQIPLDPEAVDFVLVNEVVSHINPGLLPTVWLELGRVLRIGGAMLISDGNNFDSASCRSSLFKVYADWERAPAGTDTGRDVVNSSYESRRARLIREQHPHLGDEDLQFLSANTSGMYGDCLHRVVEDYVQSGQLTLRPYRPGVCPTNPSASGVVMERAFRPEQLVLELEGFGMAAREVRSPYLGWKRRLAWQAVDRLHSFTQWLREWLSTENFQILATKKF